MMAKTTQSWQELMPNSFCPNVGVLCTDDAEAICQKNNLSFVEMMRPFCQLTSEAHVRDAQNQAHIVKNLRLRFSSPVSSAPSQSETSQVLRQTVLRSQPAPMNVPAHVVRVGDSTVNVMTPWFEAFREQYIQLMRVSDHEYIRHYVGCLFVVSSGNNRAMDAFISLKNKQVEMAREKSYPKWFTPHVFLYYLLLHDVTSGEEERAQSLFQSMKASFGPNCCHLLKINSRHLEDSLPSGMPDPWGQYLQTNALPDEERLVDEDEEDGRTSSLTPLHLADEPSGKKPADGGSSIRQDALLSPVLDPLTAGMDMAVHSNHVESSGELIADNLSVMPKKASVGMAGAMFHGHCLTVSDHDRLRIFVNEMAIRGLVPHIERTIRALTDQVNSKKGLQRTLYSATKKWFTSSSKPAVSSGQSYSSEAAEMQTRKLADLAFLVQLYDTSWNWYHTAKRDFHNDHAMMHYAGALEMAAVSMFMQGAYKRDPQAYFEEALSNYDGACKAHQFAVRSALLYFEYLKFKGLYREASAVLIRMAAEDNPLWGALLMEQAAICFLRVHPPMARKYAFYMLSAAHRFKKAYQRRHALRAYSQALQFYQGREWWRAEDHINYTIGRLAMALREVQLAHESFGQLLLHPSIYVAARQQTNYLQEFILSLKLHLYKLDKLPMEKAQMSISSSISDVSNLPPLRVPLIDAQAVCVLLTGVTGHYQMEFVSVSNDAKQKTDTSRTTSVTVAGMRSLSQGTDEQEWKKEKEEMWLAMEEVAARYRCSSQNGDEAEGSAGDLLSLPVGFVRDVNLFGPHTDNSHHPRCVHGELVLVEVKFANQLQIPLTLQNVALLWQHIPASASAPSSPQSVGESSDGDTGGLSCTNPSACTAVAVDVLKEVKIPPSSSKPVCLSLTPLQEGKLHVLGVVYTLRDSSAGDGIPVDGRSRSLSHREVIAAGLRGRQEVEPRGPRLNQTKEQRSSVIYGPDRRLQLAVYPPMPQLQIEFSNFPPVLLSGEVRRVPVKLKNTGPVALQDLRVVCPSSQHIVWGKACTDRQPGSVYATMAQPTPSDASSTCRSSNLDRKMWPVCPLPASNPAGPMAYDNPNEVQVMEIPLPNRRLDSGSTAEVECWVQGGLQPGLQTMDMLFYYDAVGDSELKHRVLRHTSHVHVTESVRISARARRSTVGKTSPDDTDLNQLILSLDVENLSQADPSISPKFAIQQVVCVSPNLTMSSLSTARGPVLIHARETALLHFKACHVDRPSDDSSREQLISDLPFLPAQVDSLATPCLDLFCADALSRPLLGLSSDRTGPSKPASGSSWLRSEVQAKASQAVSSGTRPAACMATPIGFVVLWQAYVQESGGWQMVYGQHHVSLSTLEKSVSSQPTLMSVLRSQPTLTTTTSNSPQEQQLFVKAFFEYPASVQHDFSKICLCLVAVKLVVINCQDIDLAMIVESLSSGQPSENETRTGSQSSSAGSPLSPLSQGSNLFSWVGCTKRIVCLQARQHLSLSMQVCVSQAGVFNLARLRILAGAVPDSGVHGVTSNQLVEQLPLPVSLLIVQDIDSSKCLKSN